MHIQIDEISKEFGTTAALSPVSLSIPSGALVALLGPSGSGKTTLLRILGGLEFPSSGRVLFDGQDATGLSVQERRADASCYDLLASEARLACFVGIAQGALPKDSWFALGRLLTRVGGDPVLLSWSGSMFEYLMPQLVMPEFDRTLRNVTAAVTARAVGRPVEEVTVGGGDVVEQLERSSAADFGLRGELPYIDAVIAAVNDEANLVEKEHKIDLIRWNEAVELATFDYFDINSILSYLLRVNIVARWTQLDAVRGREMFERLMAELDGKGLIENKQ